MAEQQRTVALIGPGRAGTTIALGLLEQGWTVVGVGGRAPDAPSTASAAACLASRSALVSEVARGAALVLVATPDRAIEQVLLTAEPAIEPGALVVHLAGSRGLDVFAPLLERRTGLRVGALHPLQSFPSATAGLERLEGAWAAVAGDRAVADIARSLGLRPFELADSDRGRYHAAAVIASNHLVALLGQVERLATTFSVPFEAFAPLVRASVQNAFALGPADALTGPVARGDLATVEQHLRDLDPGERDAYRALAREAARLTGRARYRPRPPARRSAPPTRSRRRRITGTPRGTRSRLAGGDSQALRSSGQTRQSGPGKAGTERGRTMLHIETIADLRAACDRARSEARRVGLVPTMGFLHEGHRSLMRAAREACGFVVVTIFVNPLQFGADEDLDRYPRDLRGDLAQCEREGVDVVFTPSVAEMYPSGPPLTTVHVDGLSAGMCGAARPTHFDGVGTVVTKLFSIAGPCSAFFGRKDAQQLAVIARLVEDLNLPVEVVGCPIVREPDGLARSSRNAYLSPEQRRGALVLGRALEAAADATVLGERDARVLVDVVRRLVSNEPEVALEYVEVRAAHDLVPVELVDGDVLLALAARVGTTRLIDNVVLSVRGPDVHVDLGSRMFHRGDVAELGFAEPGSQM